MSRIIIIEEAGTFAEEDFDKLGKVLDLVRDFDGRRTIVLSKGDRHLADQCKSAGYNVEYNESLN